MSSIDLYDSSPDSYDALQHKRPDYVGAQNAFVDLASKYLKGMNNVAVADFCCGVGKDTRLLGEHISIGRAVLVDVNAEFLRLAGSQGIKAKKIETIESDIVQADIPSGNDVIISMFAYHHVPDDRKTSFVAKAKAALKPGGIVILGEIYSPDRRTTLEYYEHLINAIPEAQNNLALTTFLRQTAKSEDFEYKVSRQFAHEQFQNAGFKLLESKKIWPNFDAFSEDVGTFVEVWKI